MHCTAATRDLAELLLRDSARIQESDAERANRRGYSRHRPARPLYTNADAEKALKQFVTVDWETWFDVGSDTEARFFNAGHILGSGVVEMRTEHAGREVTVVFSGDVGRYDMPLHVDPVPLPRCDALHGYP